MKFILLLLFLIPVNFALSQTPEINIGVGINTQIPPENYEINDRMGLYLQGSYFIPLNSLLKIGFEGSYTRLLVDDDNLINSLALNPTSFSIDGFESQLITSFLSLRAYKDVLNSLQIYSTLGFGVFYQIQNEGKIVYGDSFSNFVSNKTTDFGAKLGFGISTSVSSSISIYFELAYISGFTETNHTHLIPMNIGVKHYFNSFK